MLVLVRNGKPVYFPSPKLKWNKIFFWANVYGAIWAILGSNLALGSLLVQTVLFPLAYMVSKKFRCSFTYFHYIQKPFIDHENTKAFGIDGARNHYIGFQSSVDQCEVNLGAWHVLPNKVYEANKEFIGSANKEDKDKFFEDQLRNTDVPVILYCHGLTQSRAYNYRVELYKVLQEMDVHVIAFDYRGFADSTLVVPSQGGMVEDTLMVYSWLRKLVGEKPVFVWAHSIGTGVALKSFNELGGFNSREGLELPPPNGIILENSFNNIYELLEHHAYAKLFNWLPHFYSTLVRSVANSPDVCLLPEVEARTMTSLPVLMLQAADDDVIPFELGTKLYGEIVESRKNEEERPIFKIFRTAGHTHICRDTALPGVVRKFFKKYT